jgi:hypothetical protein
MKDRFRLRDGTISTKDVAIKEAITTRRQRIADEMLALTQLEHDLAEYHTMREANRPCSCGQLHSGFLGNCTCGHSYAHHLKIYEGGVNNHHCDLCECKCFRYDRRFTIDRRKASV